jgi:hypothetical protein
MAIRAIPAITGPRFVPLLRGLGWDCGDLPHCAALCRWQRSYANATIASFQKIRNEGAVMKKYLFLSLLLTISTAWAQQSNRLPDNRTLISNAHSFYVQTDTFYMKREALESSLLGQPEFKAWDLQITGKEELADMVVRVKRVPFSNHFSYTVTDRGTDTIVMAGKVDSLAGTVYGRIAWEIVDKMKTFRGNPLKPENGEKQASRLLED